MCLEKVTNFYALVGDYPFKMLSNFRGKGSKIVNVFNGWSLEEKNSVFLPSKNKVADEKTPGQTWQF